MGTGKRIQSGVPGEGPGPGSKDRVQGGLQGRGPGSVELGRAAQDEGGILASLRASIASAGPGPSERASGEGSTREASVLPADLDGGRGVGAGV